MAANRLRHEQRLSMSPDSLLDSVYRRLKESESRAQYTSTRRFYGMFRRKMRDVIIDHIRKRRAKKREHELAAQDVDTIATDGDSVDALVEKLGDALHHVARSGKNGPRIRRIIELVCLKDLTHERAGEVIGVSARTVYRDLEIGAELVEAFLTGDLADGPNQNGAPAPDDT
jgi:DNA-directed RNA polymerase specialized sigma24 family protein